MVKRPSIKRNWGLTASAIALAASLGYSPADSQEFDTRPTLNFYGVTGLIDMPTAESQPDGMLNITYGRFGGINRTTLSFQLTPRLSGSFRYTGVERWDNTVASPWSTYFDRSFDLRYQALDEGRYLPAVAIGLQDFIGTGLSSAEYVVATKHLTPTVKVTGGLGWGRLGSYNSVGSPFGARPAVDIGRGGKANTGQWFRGPMAPFGGVEWQINDQLGVKLEYSSDNYDLEAGTRRVFERKSPWSIGAEYQFNEALRLGGYYAYGSELGFTAQFTLNPKKRAAGLAPGPGPLPIKARPSRSADPDAWSAEWVTQPDAGELLRKNIGKQLAEDGLELEALALSGQRAQLRLRNNTYDAEAQAIGRAARAMARSLPASVEIFEIVPVVNGVAASKVTIRRSDLEALEYTPGNAEALRARTQITDAGAPPDGLVYNEGLYPRFAWSISPYTRLSFFDPDDPVRADFGLRAKAHFDIAPGWRLSGSVTKKLVGNLDKSTRVSNSVLPHVRSDANLYDRDGDPALEHLTLDYRTRLAEDIYGRVTAGYLERMFGGVSAEVLWKPVDSRLALGAELNVVKQRNTDVGLGFQNYQVVTGHASAYYDFGGGYHGQLDAGRYLAGDWGMTVSLDREFDNGWKVGAFATFTNVSAAEFGEGSFDKGIRLEIPLTWATGTPSRSTYETVLRPVTRDGGARLNVNDRLYGSVRDYHTSGIDAQWGRVWK